jgi:intracellular multiplication protein IcmE
MSKSDNNPDTDLDQEQEFDTNLGFDDPGQDQTEKNNPLIKIGLIAGALVVVVIGIFMMGGGNNNQLPPSQVGATTANPNALPGQTAPTPEYREAIEERNREQIETAKENNTSVMPLAVDPARATLQGEATQASETVVERHRRIQAEYERQRQLQQAQNQTQMNEAIAQAQAQQVQTLSQSMSTYLNSAMSARSPGGMSEMDIGYTTAGAGDGTGGAAMSGTAGGGGAAIDPSTALPSEPRTLLPAAAVEYGQLLIEANTDAPGPVLALMASGKLAGGRLLGSFSQTEDYITLNFNQVVTKDGRSIPIQAICH